MLQTAALLDHKQMQNSGPVATGDKPTESGHPSSSVLDRISQRIMLAFLDPIQSRGNPEGNHLKQQFTFIFQ